MFVFFLFLSQTGEIQVLQNMPLLYSLRLSNNRFSGDINVLSELPNLDGEVMLDRNQYVFFLEPDDIYLYMYL